MFLISVNGNRPHPVDGWLAWWFFAACRRWGVTIIVMHMTLGVVSTVGGHRP